jgi:hypothetical protein
LITPKYPEEPPRTSEPLAAHAPAFAVHVHIGVEPPGIPVPTVVGHPLADIESPLVNVTPSPPAESRETNTVPLPLFSVIAQDAVIESSKLVSFQIGHGLFVVQFPAATRTVGDVFVT